MMNIFHARFQTIGAAHPCRRGCASLSTCVWTAGEKRQYLARLSRPLLDRIDLHLDVPAVPYAELSGTVGETSAVVRARVEAAREGQRARFAGVRPPSPSHALLDGSGRSPRAPTTSRIRRAT